MWQVASTAATTGGLEMRVRGTVRARTRGMARAREGVMARVRVQGVERACCVPGQGDDDDITFLNKV